MDALERSYLPAITIGFSSHVRVQWSREGAVVTRGCSDHERMHGHVRVKLSREGAVVTRGCMVT